MNDHIVFATKNKDKLKEIQKIITVISMEEAGYHLNIVEDGKTYEENAMKKATTIMKASGFPTLADDSGIEIDFLLKMPGVNSSTFLTTNDNYKDRNQQILKMMARTANRKARFVSVIAFAAPNGTRLYTKGYLEGEIAKEAAGTHGFAYDEIFFLPSLNKTLGQLTLEEKNKISHRSVALREMVKLLG